MAVGTVDQVMLAGLQVKWSHFRAATLARSSLVIDEIHASDSYMSAILSRVVGDHVARGGHALLMSATLGAAARAQPLNPRRRSRPDPSPGYPAISWIEGGRAGHRSLKAAGGRKAVAVTAAPLIGRTKAIAARALAATRQGARALVIRNTVDQVVALHEAIEALDPDAPLLTVNGIRSPITDAAPPRIAGSWMMRWRTTWASAPRQAAGSSAPPRPPSRASTSMPIS